METKNFIVIARYQGRATYTKKILEEVKIFLQDLIQKNTLLSLHALCDDSGTLARVFGESREWVQENVIEKYPLHENFAWEIIELSEANVIDLLDQMIEGMEGVEELCHTS
jgi:hypothetical protein